MHMVHGEEFTIQTKGFSDIHDVTGRVGQIVDNAGITDGIVTVHAIGSTASISTIECEPALNADFKDELEKFVPHSLQTRHSRTRPRQDLKPGWRPGHPIDRRLSRCGHRTLLLQSGRQTRHSHTCLQKLP